MENCNDIQKIYSKHSVFINPQIYPNFAISEHGNMGQTDPRNIPCIGQFPSAPVVCSTILLQQVTTEYKITFCKPFYRCLECSELIQGV